MHTECNAYDVSDFVLKVKVNFGPETAQKRNLSSEGTRAFQGAANDTCEITSSLPHLFHLVTSKQVEYPFLMPTNRAVV